MSFIVKGIDLPKDKTIVIHYANRYGEMETVYVDESDIIQIPKEHGILIDGDAFIRHLQDIFCDKCKQHKKYGGIICRTCNIIDIILEYGDAPKILEAEE